MRIFHLLFELFMFCLAGAFMSIAPFAAVYLGLGLDAWHAILGTLAWVTFLMCVIRYTGED